MSLYTQFQGNYNKYWTSGIAIMDDRVLAFGDGSWDTAGEAGRPDIWLGWDGTNGRLELDATSAKNFLVNSNVTTEFDGAVNFDGAVDFDSTVNFAGATVTGVDLVIPFVQSEAIATNTTYTYKFQAPFAMTITEVSYFAAGTITTSGTQYPGIQVLEGTTTILSTSDYFQLTSTTTATAPAAGGIANNADIVVEFKSGNATATLADDTSTQACATVVLTAERA